MRVLTAASTLKNRWFSHLDDRFPSGSYDLNSRAQNLLLLAWKTSGKKRGFGLTRWNQNALYKTL